jgi:hypothetical protein
MTEQNGRKTGKHTHKWKLDRQTKKNGHDYYFWTCVAPDRINCPNPYKMTIDNRNP